MYDMFCNAGDTPYKRRHCDRCGKCFTKTTFLKMHKFRHSAGTKPFLQEKLWVLREIVSKTNFPDDSHVLLTQEKRLTNSGLWYLWKIFYENHCNDDAQISPHWGEAIFRRRIESFVKNCSQNQSPRWVTCLLTQEKSLTNAVIVISVENVYKTAVLKRNKFCHSGAKPFLEGKLWVLWANVFYTNIPDESHVNSHRRKALQTQKCDICGKYISKPLAWRCTNIATVGWSHF